MIDPNYAAIPENVRRHLNDLYVRSSNAFLGRNFQEAAASLEEQYRILVDQQTLLGQRFHKGWQLYNWGIALLNAGNSLDATTKIFLAYIEDALSAEIGDEASADERLAGKVLRESFEFGRLLELAKQVVRVYNSGENIPADPQHVLNEVMNRALAEVGATSQATDEIFKDTAEHLERTETVGKRTLEGLTKPFEKRCFVGCNYFTDGYSFNSMKRIIESLGWDAIAARDFEMGDEDVHHRSLLLLHLCSKAVFEVTNPGGQLMELERCRDYGLTPLIVRGVIDDDPRMATVSAMIRSMTGQEVNTYSDDVGLTGLIESYLTG